jgi:hypothetical protein
LDYRGIEDDQPSLRQNDADNIGECVIYISEEIFFKKM